MKIFRKHIFPALYGLLVYFTIRLLHDIAVASQFWKRNWALNLFEICCSILAGYAAIQLFRWLIRRFDRHSDPKPDYRSLARELTILIAANLALMNLTFTPMAAWTDDGLSWADFIEINLITTLYAVIYYGISRSIILLKGYVANKIQLEKVTNDQLKTELKFLRAQYHPHFLFNALNTIYFQMDDDVPGAKYSIEKFSELLRYKLYDQQQQVPVSQEFEYMQTYIELQKVRSTGKLNLQVSFDDRLKNQLVYPLMFLPLLENAFKFLGGNYRMSACATINDEYIVFSIENSVSEIISPSNGGIGLENLRRRLNLLYPDRHILNLERMTDRFKAVLKLAYEQ